MKRFSNNQLLILIHLFALAAVTVLIYKNSLNYQLFYDSLGTMDARGLKVWANKSWADLIFHIPRGLFWGPLYKLNQIFDIGTHGYRTLNLTFHILNGGLIYYLSYHLLKHNDHKTDAPTKTSSRLTLSFITSALFLLHPVAVYGVAYTVQITTVAATFFGLLTVILFLKGSTKQSLTLLLMSCLTYYVSVHIKPHAVMIPAVCGLLIIQLKSIHKKNWHLYLLPFLILSAIALQVTFLAQEILGHAYEPWAGKIQNDINPTLASEVLPSYVQGQYLWLRSILNQAGLYFRYLCLWIIPNPALISIDTPQPFPSTLFSFNNALSGLGLLIYLITGLWLLLKKQLKSLLGFLMLAPLALFCTEFSTVRQHESFVLYRSYLWMSFFVLAIPLIISLISKKIRWFVLLAYITVLIFLTHDRLQTFSNPISLWEDATQKIDQETPNNLAAYHPFVFLGGYYSRAGQSQKAIQALKTAIKLNPSFYLSYYNLGLTYSTINEFPNAIKNFKKTLELFPGSHSARYNLANAYLKNKQILKAIETYHQLLIINPKDTDSLHNMAIAHFQNKNFKKAVETYQTVLKLQPNHRKAPYNYANALMIYGDNQEALKWYNQALRINPKAHMAWHNRALALIELKKYEEAIQSLQQSLKIKPGFEPSLRIMSGFKKQ